MKITEKMREAFSRYWHVEPDERCDNTIRAVLEAIEIDEAMVELAMKVYAKTLYAEPGAPPIASAFREPMRAAITAALKGDE